MGVGGQFDRVGGIRSQLMMTCQRVVTLRDNLSHPRNQRGFPRQLSTLEDRSRVPLAV